MSRILLQVCVIVFAISFVNSFSVSSKFNNILRKTTDLSIQNQCTSRVTSLTMSTIDRRGMIAFAGFAFLSLSTPQSSKAEVFTDTERYGDKELKVAILNQIKQQFRALFEKKPELLVPIFQLAVADALSFNAETKEGGMDSSILFKLDEPGNVNLKAAGAEVQRIHKELVDKTQVTKADLIAFGGAVAIEATGGPRVIVQLGRSDGQAVASADEGSRLDWSQPSVEGIRSAAKRSGLTDREMVLIAGALGSLQDAAAAMSVRVANKLPPCDPNSDSQDDCDEDEAEEGYFGIYAPVTIMSETSKQFGKNRGASAVNSNTGFDSARIAGLAGSAKFSNAFLAGVASRGGGGDALAAALASDKALRALADEYARDGRRFVREAAAAYDKLTALGRSSVSARADSVQRGSRKK